MYCILSVHVLPRSLFINTVFENSEIHAYNSGMILEGARRRAAWPSTYVFRIGSFLSNPLPMVPPLQLLGLFLRLRLSLKVGTGLGNFGEVLDGPGGLEEDIWRGPGSHFFSFWGGEFAHGIMKY